MALRDQPYLPLYIQDIMTDEKLNECSAATHGIFIKGIMCLMHKSEQYGKILLKQKDKQSTDQIKNFAVKMKKHLPYEVEEIQTALVELLTEKVLKIEGDSLCQKRMIEDNRISELRAQSGKKGAEKKDFAKANTKANQQANSPTNTQANSENEYESENESVSGIELKEKESEKNSIDESVPRESNDHMTEEWFAKIFDSNYMGSLTMPFRGLNLQQELSDFKVKVRGAPSEYKRDSGGIRNAFLYQLRQAREKKTGKPVKVVSQDRMNEFKNMRKS